MFGREAGEKEKESALEAMGRAKKGNGAFSLFPSPLARLLLFDHCYFYWDTQREPLRRRELTNDQEKLVYTMVPRLRLLSQYAIHVSAIFILFSSQNMQSAAKYIIIFRGYGG